MTTLDNAMANKHLKIYVSGPYTAETEIKKLKNVTTAIDAAIKVYRKGHFPYIPHLTHFLDKRAKESGVSLKWNDYMKWHDIWLNACDAFLYLRNSKGANLELNKAKKLSKKIFYSVNEIPSLSKLTTKRRFSKR